jgi:hypothetical protein
MCGWMASELPRRRRHQPYNALRREQVDVPTSLGQRANPQTLEVRGAAERGHTNHGWLDTWHTFSFETYYDPECRHDQLVRRRL